MKRFIITLRHDHGRARITTYARTASTALQMVLEAERAPISAVISVTSFNSLVE